MAEPSRLIGEQHFAGPIVFLDTVTMPSGAVGNAEIEAGAAIAATKLQHQFPLVHTQKTGTDVTAQTDIVHVARGAGTLVSVEAVVDTVPTGTGVDLKVTIDVKKSTGGGAFTSLLSAAFDIDDGYTDKVLVAGTVGGSNTYADGDLLEVIVAVSGSVGSQAQGLCVTCFVYEATA